jgi:hypothetical protein
VEAPVNWREAVPWIAGAAAIVAVSAGARGCAIARADRDRYRTDAQRSADALKGADANLEAIRLRLTNKDEKIRELTERVKKTACEGELVEKYGPDGALIERRCVGKARSEENDRGSRATEKTTPDLPNPFEPPAPLQPSAVAPAIGRWSFAAGAGISLDPFRVPVYFGSVGYRLAGPVWLEAWGHFPAAAAGLGVRVAGWPW